MGGKSSGQTTGYKYFSSFCSIIGNRIEKLIGLNFDNRGWIKVTNSDNNAGFVTINKPNLFGEAEGGVKGIINIHHGLPNPEPDEHYQQYDPLISGFPYQSYLVFRGSSTGNSQRIGNIVLPPSPPKKGFYIGNINRPKECLLQVKRTRVKNDGTMQWYIDRPQDNAIVCEINAEGGAGGYIEPTPLKNIRVETKSNHYENGIRTEIDESYHENVALINNPIGINNQAGPYAEYFFSQTNDKFEFDFDIRFEDLAAGMIVVVVEASMGNIGQRPIRYNDFNISIPVSEVVTLSREDIDRRVVWTITIDSGAPFSLSGSVVVDLYKDENEYYFHHSAKIKHIYQKPKTIWSDDSKTDINPIHKIREILTDDTAMNKPESDVNDENFRKAADRIYDEGLGISWAIDEMTCSDALDALCHHIEGGVRQNRQTGMYEVVLFRDDWFAPEEVHEILENKIKSIETDIVNVDDVTNELNVTYYDRELIKNSSFSIADAGLVLTTGNVNAESIDFPYFMNMRNAEIVANWKLIQESTPAWSGTFTTGWREARKWNRYDLVYLHFSKQWENPILVRIMSINLGNPQDNTVTIKFKEVVPYSTQLNTIIVPDEPVVAPPSPPLPNPNFHVFEMPYFFIVMSRNQRDVDSELAYENGFGLVSAVAAQSQANSTYGALTIKDVGDARRSSNIDYDMMAVCQQTVERIDNHIIVDIDFSVASAGTLMKVVNLDESSEWIVFESFDIDTMTMTVKRGALDTIPININADARIFATGSVLDYDSIEYVDGDVLLAKVLTATPSGLSDESLTPWRNVEMNARAFRPYPPANVKINDEYWPLEIETDLILTWAHRNRVQQTTSDVLGWYDSSVTIESGASYNLKLTELDEDNTELRMQNISLGAVDTYTFATSNMDASTRYIEIELKTVRDGYDSLKSFTHKVELSQFFSAPYDLTVEYKND